MDRAEALRYLNEPFDKFDLDKQAYRTLISELLARISSLEEKTEKKKK